MSLETEGMFSTLVKVFLKEKNPSKSGKLVPQGRKINVIDLFCGCGGFSLGLKRAGFHILAGIDFDTEAVATYRKNLPDVPHVLQKDLTDFTPHELQGIIDNECVDVIVGGPPCQGFSTARQRDGANHGRRRLIHDERRYLYREFLLFVKYFQPTVFVMENVPGIRSAAGGEYFTKVQKESRALGYRVHTQIEDAWELGVPQKRRRQLIVGVQNGIPGYFLPNICPPDRAIPRPSLGLAIGDLPALKAGNGDDEREYDLVRRERHLRNHGEDAHNYIYRVLEIGKADRLTNHVARPHNARDLRDFKRLHEGESSAVAIRERGVKFEFPYDKSRFKDRYTRQSRRKSCSTIVAHLSKDGLMFIHPTQNRSLTPREAARIQSFPDWFRFPAPRTVAFSLIGNAVPPLVAEAVGIAVKAFLNRKIERLDSDYHLNKIHAPYHPCSAKPVCGSEIAQECQYLPKTPSEAAEILEHLAGQDIKSLRSLSLLDFISGWHALLYLFPDLHPNNALDHGHSVQIIQQTREGLNKFARLTARRYARSGWPLRLEAVGREAWRRHESGELNDDVFYCQIAQHAGWALNNPRVTGTGKQASAV